jgi:hypothetical protein
MGEIRSSRALPQSKNPTENAKRQGNQAKCTKLDNAFILVFFFFASVFNFSHGIFTSSQLRRCLRFGSIPLPAVSKTKKAREEKRQRHDAEKKKDFNSRFLPLLL